MRIERTSIPAIKWNKRQDKQQNQIKATDINYEQNSRNFLFKKLDNKAKLASDENKTKHIGVEFHQKSYGFCLFWE